LETSDVIRELLLTACRNLYCCFCGDRDQIMSRR
jgi:hypothetical protein